MCELSFNGRQKVLKVTTSLGKFGFFLSWKNIIFCEIEFSLTLCSFVSFLIVINRQIASIRIFNNKSSLMMLLQTIFSIYLSYRTFTYYALELEG